MPQNSYAFAVGSIRVLETRMLDRSKWNRLCEAASEEEALKLLSEFGYGGGNDTLDKMIAHELGAARKTILELTPEPDLSDLLSLRIDGQNL